MYQYLSRKVKWIVWYTKYKTNIGSKKHSITMALGSFEGQQVGTTDVYISAYGNGVKANFEPLQLIQSDSNGLRNFDTVSDSVLPFDISTLTLHRHDRDGSCTSKLFVRWIEIDKGKYHRFPFFKWMKQDTYSSRSDTLLPQDEGSQYYSDVRGKQLANKRLQYEFELYRADPNVPVMTNLVFPEIKMTVSAAILKMRSPERWPSFDKMNKAYRLYFKKPAGMDHWDNDMHFAQQRLNQCNWSLIERVVSKDVLEKTMTIDENRLKQIMKAEISDMISEDRLFITNLRLTEGLEIPSPVVLFQQTTDSGFLPVAIQLNQPDDKNSHTKHVFYPDASNTWKLAKMWANLADASIHLGVVHLGLTHLLMEGVDICSNRHLSTRHPVYKLLAPHFYFNLLINNTARDKLLGPGEYIDKTMTIKTEGVVYMLGKRLKDWRMDIDGTLPADLRKRGLLCTDENGNEKVNIPGFFFAEDGLKIYNAVREYVDDYVKYYYTGEDDNDTTNRLLNDSEIQSFCRVLMKPRAAENGGIGIKGVPNTDGRFMEIDQLTDTLTSIIFICTVMHAATNFPQYDEYGFPPNYTTTLHKVPPTNDKKLSDQDLLNCLPSVKQTFDIMKIFTLLSQETTLPLGQFEVQYIEDQGALEILEKFRGNLHKIEGDIKGRNDKIIEENEKRSKENRSIVQYPYERLLPKNIPNSIAI
ncbi:ALOX5 [Mytilus coruscus]|uniref:ALOX5 n=1 Tax=Mytilus coruscus TaxID=42192 RepID=A0A6J8EU34_MYTCO|nr:ALOX5 [Mytilus coruscus]